MPFPMNSASRFFSKKTMVLLAAAIVLLILAIRVIPKFLYRDTLPPSYKLTVFLTADVESPSRVGSWHPFQTTSFVTGKGIAEEPGVGLIMSLQEKHHLRGNYFLDVYEAQLYDDKDLMKHVAQDIVKRGHELDLHCHAEKFADRRSLVQYSPEGQLALLQYGENLVYQWTGQHSHAFRAGAYLLNDATMDAVHKMGIPLDTSVFHGNRRNLFSREFTHNAIATYHGVVELPITTVQEPARGEKFDIDRMKLAELLDVIHQAEAARAQKVVFMMHSFSLIKFSLSKRGEPLVPDDEKINRYDRFLDALASDPHVKVETFGQWYAEHKNDPDFAHQEAEFLPRLP